MNNKELFESHLKDAYIDLFQNDADYSYAAARKTPAELASLMTVSLARGEANLEGKGITRACKAVGIKKTRKAIKEFLNKP